MSNKVTIEPTEFKNVRSGSVTYGVRVYDDYNCSYINTWDSIPDDDIDVLAKVVETCDDSISDTIDFLKEHEQGVSIGDTWYDYDEIKDEL